MKKQKINIEQKDGVIKVYHNDQLAYVYDCNYLIKSIKDDGTNAIGLANELAEMIHDALNCKKASASLKDLNDTRSYRGTYFEQIDFYN